MDIFKKIEDVLTELLDIEAEEITPETYVIRDLNAESIDLLELAVGLNSSFNIDINDDEIFLRNLRLYLTEAKQIGKDALEYLVKKFPFLTRDRIEEIMADLKNGPVLKVKDLVSFVAWQMQGG
jgi:acyl carrier protein